MKDARFLVIIGAFMITWILITIGVEEIRRVLKDYDTRRNNERMQPNGKQTKQE